MNDKQKRLEALGQRFSTTPAQKKRRGENNTRERHSLYIDADLMKRLDTVFKEVQHAVYPKDLTKALFMEKLIERGLDDIETVKSTLLKEE